MEENSATMVAKDHDIFLAPPTLGEICAQVRALRLYSFAHWHVVGQVDLYMSYELVGFLIGISRLGCLYDLSQNPATSPAMRLDNILRTYVYNWWSDVFVSGINGNTITSVRRNAYEVILSYDFINELEEIFHRTDVNTTPTFLVLITRQRRWDIRPLRTRFPCQ